MGELVEVKGSAIFCDSQNVSEKFGVQHIRVLAAIEKLKAEYSGLGKVCTDAPLQFVESDKKSGRQTFKVYFMDRRSFSLLSMKFKGKKALEWQVKFNDAFYEMERRLLLESANKQSVTWEAQREQGKIARHAETDTIKEFVEYAESQGSKNAKFYYKHITVACYRCLQLIESEKPKVRDLLDVLELNQLMLAEVVAERSLKKHMAGGEHYKAIFALVKNDLESFAGSLMIPGKSSQLQITE